LRAGLSLARRVAPLNPQHFNIARKEPIKMRTKLRLLLFVTAATFVASLLFAQGPQTLNVLSGTQLGAGLALGINTSDGITNWLTPESSPSPGDLKMVCPAAQAWCAMYITDGQAISTYPRPGLDVSAFQTLIVEIEGDPGTTIRIGLKDATQPDDGTETKVTLPVTSNWTAYAIPLSSFATPVLAHGGYVIDFHKIYVPCEFVFAGGPQAQTVKVRTITYTTAPAPSLVSVTSAASYVAGAGADTWVSVFGKNLSTNSRGWQAQDFQQNHLPAALDGVGLTVNGRPMAISYISPGQINALVFSDVPVGQAYVSVTNSVGVSVPLTLNIQALFPALFTFSPPYSKYAAAVGSSDGAYIAPPGAFGAGVTARPAKPGEIIELYGTGFGPTNPLDTPGMLLQEPLPLASASQVQILFGSMPSPNVSFAGLSEVGLYQFNVVVPGVADGDQPVVVKIGSATSQSNVFVTVKN
jgi:uncharacterized protein (TIGR03437 family)